MCSACRDPGATLGCLFKSCPNKYHYRCALESGESRPSPPSSTVIVFQFIGKLEHSCEWMYALAAECWKHPHSASVSGNSSSVKCPSAAITSELPRVGAQTFWVNQCEVLIACSVLVLADGVLIEENFSMKCKKHKVRTLREFDLPAFVGVFREYLLNIDLLIPRLSPEQNI